MQPEHPQTSYGSGNGQYDFIVNPGAPSKKPLIPKLGGGGSFTKKLLFILGVAFILAILMWIVGNIIGGSRLNTADIVSMTQVQQEIIRVAEEGTQNAANQNLKNNAMNTALAITSQQKEWLAFLAQRGVTVKDKDLALKQNTTTDKNLKDAKASSTFDLAFDQVMENYLAQYASALKADFEKSTHTAQRALLSTHYTQVQLLLQEYENIK